MSVPEQNLNGVGGGGVCGCKPFQQVHFFGNGGLQLVSEQDDHRAWSRIRSAPTGVLFWQWWVAART